MGSAGLANCMRRRSGTPAMPGAIFGAMLGAMLGLTAGVGEKADSAALLVLMVPMPKSVAAGFRIERSVLDSYGQTQLSDQTVEHVIVLVGQPILADLQGNVPVAEAARAKSWRFAVLATDNACAVALTTTSTVLSSSRR